MDIATEPDRVFGVGLRAASENSDRGFPAVPVRL